MSFITGIALIAVGLWILIPDKDDESRCRSYRFFVEKLAGFCRDVQDVAIKGYEMGRSDPRKIVFAAKMGLALMLLSLLIFLKEPMKDLETRFLIKNVCKFLVYLGNEPETFFRSFSSFPGNSSLLPFLCNIVLTARINKKNTTLLNQYII